MASIRQDQFVPGRFGDWPLWSRPAVSGWYVLALDIGALAVIAGAFPGADIGGWPPVLATVLVAAAVVQGEASRRIERARRVMSGSVHINMVSVWVFGAVLTLPMFWVGVVTALVSTHLVLRSYQVHRGYTHRQVMNAAALVLAAWTARGILDTGSVHQLTRDMALTSLQIGVVVLAAVVFFLVDGVLIVVSLLVDSIGERTFGGLVGSVEDNALELATICLGAVVGLVLVYQPYAMVFLFVPLFVLHRSALVKQLEEQATRDDKTGLLKASSWHDTAVKKLAAEARRRSGLGVLMVDLDHFKRVNDTYGHLAGDQVLQAVATTVRDAVGHYDAVGRFGGEEFVVLLSATAPREVVGIAERVRSAVSQLRVALPEAGTVLSTLTASIGVACYPDAGDSVDELVRAADTALYRAKNGGRNRVVSTADLATPDRAVG